MKKKKEIKTKATVHFYKKEGNWYAAVPGHTEAQNRMVAGFDKLLDIIARMTNKETVTLVLRTDENTSGLLGLKRTLHTPFGATYSVIMEDPRYLADICPEFLYSGITQCWICNVTHTVFGQHPKYICVSVLD